MSPTNASSLPPLDNVRARVHPVHWMLLAIIVAEMIAFSIFGTHFWSAANAYQLARLNVEVGVIALALTPVIVSGGIDLSVGSMMGLSAICFGHLTMRAGISWPAAAAVALAVGAAGGWLNGELVARFNIPPLIVTLGTLSLFRGIANGATGGTVSYTGFAPGFLRIGQAALGPIPAQAILFVVAALLFFVLLHRSTIGRSLSAIGFSPEGARHAALPVRRRLREAYILSGLCAAAAAIVYVARVGQAKADAGTGYELSAITAVVLGGTSIFGGQGSIPGTLLGLLALGLLDNGLRLSDGPSELAGILRGLLLLLAIGADRWHGGTSPPAPSPSTTEEISMRNGQLALLCITILIAALLVLGGNFALVRGLRGTPGDKLGTSADRGAATTPNRRITIGMMPKSKGNAYFISARQGAEEAAKELGVDLLWDGPTDPDAGKQNEVVDTWATRGVDVIAASVENADGISTSLRQARARGMKTVTWDADAHPDARDFFVNQATPEGIGDTLMDDAASTLGGRGEYAIITATLTAANQNEWIKWIKQRQAEKYPDIRLATIQPCDDQQPKAFDQAQTILHAYPGVKLILAISSEAVPAAAEAIKQSGRTDVHVVGLGLPNDNKPYVHAGITTAVVLWNTRDLGYLTVETAHALADGNLKAGDTAFHAGRLGDVKVVGDNVMLGAPTTFTKTNIDQFDF